ncbi:MAG: Rrf2 family transcriptional regulator [Verrucomicrobiota bacterium]
MISNKCIYALKAVLELARRESKGPVPICMIAEAQHIPPRFLEGILRQLKQAGYTESNRGKEGGYFLARPAREIHVGDILRLIDGPFIAIKNSLNTKSEVFEEVWGEAEKALEAIYDTTNFEELARKQNELSNLYVSNYSI